jgi:hypothetical protein
MQHEAKTPRYRVRVLQPGGRVEEIGSTIDRDQSLAWATSQHARTGRRVWVLDTATSRIIRELEPRQVAGRRQAMAMAGGAA